MRDKNKMLNLIILSVAFVFITINAFAQNKPIKYCGHAFNGYIYDTSFFLLKSITNQNKRINLTKAEVGLAEELLKSKLKEININQSNQVGKCPNICKKLKKYTRQYFGFETKNGEKIIWINLFWNKDLLNEVNTGVISVNDGCSYYWNIEVNITNRTLTNLDVNGGS